MHLTVCPTKLVTGGEIQNSSEGRKTKWLLASASITVFINVFKAAC